MGIKEIVRKVIGNDLFEKNKAFILNVRDRIKKNNYSSGVFHCIQIKDKNVFCGYYDVPVFNLDKSLLLIHVLRKRAKTGVDVINIGYVDLRTNKIVCLLESNAWCWQMGSRLRWSRVDNESFYYNDYDAPNNRYVARLFNTNKKEIERTYPYAFYDINRDETYGLFLDFSRLQRLRPGYGYCNRPDTTINEKCPSDNGIWKYDFISNDTKLVVSLKDLISNFPDWEQYNHYVNHISISPNGEKFIFFHIATKNNSQWKARLYVCNNDGMDRVLLEEQDNVSHYTWKNNKELLATLFNNEKSYYAVYDIEKKKKQIFGENVLTRDGHPTYINDNRGIISDTYPDSSNHQELFYYSETKKRLAYLYHSPLMYGEKRCDLHPKCQGTMIAVDSTFKDNVRSVCTFDIGEIGNE